MTDNLDVLGESRLELWEARPVAEARDAAHELPNGGFVRYDLTALARVRDYQADIERASALLCKAQPDLIAGEVIAIKETEPPRSSWPFILALAASLLFWFAIGWAIVNVI